VGLVAIFRALVSALALALDVFKAMCCASSNTRRLGKWAIVTGASDGIGKEVAIELAKKGHSVALLARSADKLAVVKEEVATHLKEGEQVMYVVADFSNGDTEKLYKHISEKLFEVLGDVGVLVNNVGVSYPGALRFEEFCDEEFTKHAKSPEDLIHVNIMAAVKMTGLVLGGMKKNKRGSIVFMSSAHGRLPIGAPLYAAYGGSKAFIETFAKSLAYECQGSGVNVQVQFPYFVATKMAKIRHASLHAPSPKAFAKSVIAATGSSEAAVIPWWFHKIEDALLLSLPVSILASVVMSMHVGLRKAYLKKLAGADSKTDSKKNK